MKTIVTADEMRSIDRYTIEELGIPGPVLMERAGLESTSLIAGMLEEIAGKDIFIFCGKGNNGGDGFVIARELTRGGAKVQVFIFAERNSLKGDALLNFQIVEKMKIPINFISDTQELNKIPNRADLAVDALLGTGIQGKVQGFYKEVIQFLNMLSVPVVSIDIPSGLNTDTGQCEGECVQAVSTITMGLLKRGLIIPPGKQLAGIVFFADIGLPSFIEETAGIKVFMPDKDDIAASMPERKITWNKTDAGKILVLSGSRGMTGAATLVGMGAMRTGAGLTVLGIPASLNPVLEEKLTEVMTFPLPETVEGTISEEALPAVQERLAWADVVALGPGLGRHSSTRKFVLSFLPNVEIPLVLDADGLFPLNEELDILKNMHSEVIITPHEGEFARLMGWETDDIRADRIERVKAAAGELGVTILLKGSPTVVATPVGDVYINPTGNAGLATGGSGDVLTGMIAGLTGQGLTVTGAGVVGAYIHGLAGDCAAKVKGEMSLIAGDLLDYIPKAVKIITEDEDENE